jgi:ligand-binding sensor domain-containing protein
MSRLARSLPPTVCAVALCVDPGIGWTQAEVRPIGPARVVALGSPAVFEQIGAAEGLPQLHITDIAQDRHGFMWFATEEGLARYDGNEMKVFRRDGRPGSLVDAFVTEVEVDAGGALWAGTSGGAICRLDEASQSFTCKRWSQGSITSMLAVPDGTVFAGDDEGHLFHIVSRGEPTTQSVADKEVPVTAIARAQSGELWLGLAGQGLGLLRPGASKPEVYRHSPDRADSLVSDNVQVVLVDGDGAIWVGTDRGLDRMIGPDRFEHRRADPANSRSLSNDVVQSLLSDSTKTLWIGTANGLNRMTSSGEFAVYRSDASPTSLSSPGVTSAYQDRAGVLWFGTFSAGLNKMDGVRRAFGLMRGETESATAFFEESPDRLWVGSWPGTLSLFDFAANRIAVFEKLQSLAGEVIDLAPYWVTSIQGDGSGLLWIGTQGAGLISFDPRTRVAEQYLPDPQDEDGSFPSSTVFRIIRDSQGFLWAATWGGGLVRIDPKRRIFEAFDDGDPSPLSSSFVYDVVEDPRNPATLWVGTAKGLNRVDRAGQVQSWTRRLDAGGLAEDAVTCVSMGADGLVWLGTYGSGLHSFDPRTGQFRRFEKGSPASQTVYGILPDEQGRLWMSTNGSGLTVFDPKTLAYKQFDSRDGVLNEYAQAAYLRGPSGLLYFGAHDGFVRFRPADIPRDVFVPPVLVTSIKIADREVELGGPPWTASALHLDYDDDILTIDFAAMSFASPGRLRYAYKLEGLQHDWFETNRRSVTYAQLDSGDYVFRVRAANGEGVWSERGASIALTVDPVPWRTWWAYGLYGVVGLGLLAAALGYQRGRLLRVQREGRLAAVERDLALTGAVQAGFLPQVDAVSALNLDLVGVYRPCQESSGDWWWHERVGDSWMILAGDVTGHGPGPAMVTAAAAAAFRVQSDLGVSELSRRIEVLNQEVWRVSSGKYIMTLSALLIDDRTGEFSYYSAGGLPLLRLESDGNVATMAVRGTPLGSAQFVVGCANGSLQSRDRLLMLTDGIVELELGNGRQLGMRRLKNLLQDTRPHSARDAAASIIGACDRMCGRESQQDDWTMVVVDWTGRAAQAEVAPSRTSAPMRAVRPPSGARS